MKVSIVDSASWVALDWDGQVAAAHGKGHPHTLVILRNAADSAGGQLEIEAAREQIRAVQRERDAMPGVLPAGAIVVSRG